MDIFLQVDQTHGTEWKKRKSKKREDVYKLTMFHSKLTGKSKPKVPE